jgi:hypothetical protein
LGQSHVVDLRCGSLALQRLELPRLVDGAQIRLSRLSAVGADLEGRLVVDGENLTVELAQPVTLHAGESLVAEIGA